MISPASMYARLRSFWKTSRRLDDRARSVPMELDQSTWAQDAVDAELSDVRQVPWARPRPGVAGQVLRTIHTRRSLPRRTTSVWSADISRPAAAVGVAVLVVGAWVGSPLLSRGTQMPAQQSAMVEPELPEGMDLMAGLAMAATPIVSGRLDEPLYQEASALRADTARAATAFLERLTIESIGSESAP